MTRTGARGTPPPPHRRRSIFREDPPLDPALPDCALPDTVLPDGPPRDERPRALTHAAETSTTPGSVRARSGRDHRSIFRPEAEHHDGPGR
ncbi:MAG TPA: hypothetical protein VNP37_13740 [Actinomycetospora sp.]|nr:hypothetical protein [Actinomycetospora sp.]